MLHTLRTRASEEKGFTLIELLVVILIIGILAAIALPTFLGQKDKAADSSTKSDVRNAISQMESCYTNTPETACPNSESPLAEDVTVTPAEGTRTSSNYVVSKVSSTGTAFTITKSGNEFDRTCVTSGAATTPANTKGGCSSGTW